MGLKKKRSMNEFYLIRLEFYHQSKECTSYYKLLLIVQALDGIPRTAYYIATKVGRYQPEVDKMFDFSAERTLQSVDESLQRMGLDYVDIIQVFFFCMVLSH